MRRPATKAKPAPPKTVAAARARPRLPVWLMAVLLALVTIALYWPVTGYDFINFDDPDYVTANPHVQGGLTWENTGWAFTTLDIGLWHPLTWISHMLDCQCFGLRPGWHHLTSLLLHAANTVLLFVVLRGMTGALWRSAVVAALFALHPLHVESVAWVAERKDVLSTFFVLLTLWAYRPLRGAEIRSPKSEVRRNPKSEAKLEVGSRRSVVGGRWSAVSLPSPIFHLLSSIPVLLRPRPDEQADDRDPAVGFVAAGLLAAWENAEG